MQTYCIDGLNISQHYNHIANQNKAANEATHQKWIESHTPLEIAEANLARSQLRSRFSMKGLPLLRDKRLVPGRTSSYMFFTKERIASEDFKNISCQDRAKLIAKEWKKIPEADRKVRFLVNVPALLPQLSLMCHTHLLEIP